MCKRIFEIKKERKIIYREVKRNKEVSDIVKR